MASISLTLFIFACVFTPVSAVKTSCRTRTNGVSGQLFCWFSENIALTYRSFVVLRYDFKITRSDQILHCNWLQDGLDCTTHLGYAFDGEVSNMLIIDMMNITQDMGGRYVCQIIGNDNDDDEYCNIDLKGENGATADTDDTPRDGVLTGLVTVLFIWTAVITLCVCGKLAGLHRVKNKMRTGLTVGASCYHCNFNEPEETALKEGIPKDGYKKNAPSFNMGNEEEGTEVDVRVRRNINQLLDFLEWSVESEVEKRLKGTQNMSGQLQTMVTVESARRDIQPVLQPTDETQTDLWIAQLNT